MKAFTSFLGSTRKRRGVALEAIITNGDVLDTSATSSPTESSILYAFPVPPSNNLPSNTAALAPMISHRTQHSPSEEYILTKSNSTPNNSLRSSQGGSADFAPSPSGPMSTILKGRTIPRGQTDSRQGHHQPEHELFESPRSAPTPPVPTTTPLTAGNMAHNPSESPAPFVSPSRLPSTSPHSVGDPDPISIFISDPPQVRDQNFNFIFIAAFPLLSQPIYLLCPCDDRK